MKVLMGVTFYGAPYGVTSYSAACRSGANILSIIAILPKRTGGRLCGYVQIRHLDLLGMQGNWKFAWMLVLQLRVIDPLRQYLLLGTTCS